METGGQKWDKGELRNRRKRYVMAAAIGMIISVALALPGFLCWR